MNRYPYTDMHEMNLDWILLKVKDMIAEWDTTKNAWTELKEFVETYFENLDVQQEINNKLDEMAAGGELAELMQPYLETQLPIEVANQIADVVALQIGAVVATQLPDVVSSQLPAIAASAAAAEVGTWLESHVDPDTGYVIDDSLTVQGAAADAKATGDAIDDVKSVFNNRVLVEDAENSLLVDSVNMFNFNSPFNVSGYLNSNGTIHSGDSYMTSHFIRVEPNTKYYVLGYGSGYTNARFLLEYTADKTPSTYSTNVSEYIVTGATTRYVRFTYSASFTSNRVGLSRLPFTDEKTKLYNPYLIQSRVGESVNQKRFVTNSPVDISGTQSLATLANHACSPRKAEKLVVQCGITSFSTLILNLIRTGTTSSQYKIEITSSAVNVTNQDGEETSYNHGLTITNDIQVLIEQNFSFSINLTLVSNGSLFKQTNIRCDRKYNCHWRVNAGGSTLTNCTVSWTLGDFDKSLWAFGDSYFGYSNRWTYYLNQYGYANNILMNAYPGEGSTDALDALKTYLSVARPKYVLWCMGMNDGSDTDSLTPSTNWMNNITEMLNLSTIYHFTPILATIPTVPTINHEAKNAWVRASGYQYIDFAEAVGAQSDGTWYSGMLSADGVHPSATGATALFMGAILGCPQLMISD